MGNNNAFGMSRRGAPGKYADLALQVRSRAGVQGPHAIPADMNLGASLALIPPTSGCAGSETDRMEKPRGRLLVYWGCDTTVRRSVWPNQQDRRAVPQNASLQGDHRVSGDGVPASLAFGIPSHDFMPAVDVTGEGALSGSIPLEWRAVSGATGYFGHAMASKSGDMILWTSSEQPKAGWALIDFLAPSQVERWVRERVIMPSSTTRCAIPAGIFAGTDGAMGRLVASGPQLARAATGQNPEWTMRLRLMSSGMTLRRECGPARRRQFRRRQSDEQPRRLHPSSDIQVASTVN